MVSRKLGRAKPSLLSKGVKKVRKYKCGGSLKK